MTQPIPILDMQDHLLGTAQEKHQFMQALRAACHEVGFFYLANHPVSPDLLQQVLASAREFFALPQHEKDKITISATAYYRGYGRLEAEKTHGIGDYKETYDLALERMPHPLAQQHKYLTFIGPNQWPLPTMPNHDLFKSTILNYMEQMLQLGSELMSVITQSLNDASIATKSDNEYQFNPDRDDAHAMLRLLHYPASNKKMLGVGEHVDSGFIALLLQDEIGGLQIQTRAGEWLDVPPRENCFIVNIGEMLQDWTSNYFRATLHRVMNHANHHRISAPFFFEPNLSSRINNEIYGDYLLKIFERSFPP